jgi:VanZ family protein
MKAFLKYHLPAILYALAILTIPSITGFRTHVIRFLLTDKLAHSLEYAIFAFLTYRSLSHLERRLGERLVLLLSILNLAIFGLVDEGLQAFIPGRQADIWDYLADLTGGLFVLAVLALLRRRQRTSA